MYVKSIELRNFKNIKSHEASFDGGVYVIKGDNEMGKSSLIAAIMAVLTGERTSDILKKGEQQGHVKAQVGERYEVTLEFNEYNPRGTLKLKDLENGVQQRSGVKTILQTLFSYSDFDAHRFVQLSETAKGRREQIEIVKSLLPKETQKRINDIENEIPQLKDERKELNRQIKDRKSWLKQYNMDDETLRMTEYEDIETLQKEREEIRHKLNEKYKANTRYNQQLKEQYEEKIEKLRKEIETHNSNVDQARKWIDKASETLHELDQFKKRANEVFQSFLNIDVLVVNDENIKAVDTDISQAMKELPEKRDFEVERAKVKQPKYMEAMPDDSELQQIDMKINSAHERNRMVDKVKAYRELIDEKDNLQKQVDSINEKIESLENEKAEIVEKSDLPIEGLSFDNEQLTLNDIPVTPDSISTSQQMELAFQIAIVKNKNVKVFKIAQGESLGHQRFQDIVRLAQEHGFQGFVERVSSDQELVIEQYNEETVS